ncbi:MAG: iron ABC transporter permease [Clostridiales bacterium]|nr:iron ABC transporter permease [Clostridiales bacterium]
MKNLAQPRPQLKGQRDLEPVFVKTVLAVLFALGLLMIFAGVRGISAFNASGYDAEAGFSYVYQMKGELDKHYQNDLAPVLDSLEAQEQAAVSAKLDEMLLAYWTDTRGDEAAARAELDAFRASLPQSGQEACTLKLFDAAFAVDGPKVSSKLKKQLAALDAGERENMRQALLLALVDESAPLNEVAAAAVEDTEGVERERMLLQLFLISADESSVSIPTELANNTKKAVRKDPARLDAYKAAVSGSVSWVSQFVVSHSRTVIMLGVLLALDIVLLAFLIGADHSWHFDIKWLIILLIIDFMLLFQMLPLIYLVVKAFFPEGGFTLETFTRLYSYPMNWSALKNTLIAAAATMVLGTVLAFPLAWLVGRTNLYGKKFFRSLFVLTYMVPPYVGAMAWLRLLNPNVGDMNVFLRTLFGMAADATGPINIYSLGGLIWVLTTFYYPYAFITISRAMEKMDPTLEEASRVSGASPLKTLFTITLPMMTPSLIAGALLVFVCAASCYGIPSIIGAPGKVHTVTTRIIEYYGLGTQGLNDATGMAVFLMIIAILVLYISDFVMAKRQYITVSGKSTRPNIVDLRKWRIPLTVLVSLFAVIVILVPFATILTTSFKVDVGKSLTDPGNFTFGQWTLIFSRSETLACLKNSLIYGAVTATVGIVIACVMSYLLQRTRIRGRKLPDFMITLGSGTPSVVIALGLIMTMKGDFGVNIYNTAYIMIVAYLIKYLMMGMRTVVSAMSQIHVSLEECSQISGATWTRTMFKITGPLIFPSIAAGWFLIFIPSFYELSMTTLLYSNTTKTIGFQLYEYWTFTSQPQACAMAFGILLIVVALNFVLNRLTKGEFSI